MKQEPTRLPQAPAARFRAKVIELVESHQLEVLALLGDAPELRTLAAELIRHASELVSEDEIVSRAVIEKVQQLLACLQDKQPRAPLREALGLLQAWSGRLPGRRASDIVQELTERTPAECVRARADQCAEGS